MSEACPSPRLVVTSPGRPGSVGSADSGHCPPVCQTSQCRQSPAHRLTPLLSRSWREQPCQILTGLCQKLNLPPDLAENAQSLWNAFRQSGLEQEQSLDWYACCVYIAALDRHYPYGPADPQVNLGSLEVPCITVSSLLRAAQVSIVDFFKKMETLKSHVQLSEAVHRHHLRSSKKYLITCLLFHKFEKIFKDVFHEDDSVVFNGSSVEQECSDRKKFTWTLFVYVKSKMSSNTVEEPELVLSFHLLLCCLNYIMRMTPGFQLKPPFNTLRVVSAENQNDLAMLGQLCDLYLARFEEVKLVQAGCLDPIIEQLPQRNGSIDNAAMEQCYQNKYKALGDIDELLFLDCDPHLVLQDKEADVNSNTTENSSSVTAPKEASMFLTPVRAAMTSVQQLQDLLANADDEGSEILKGYFKQCTVNPETFIVQLLADLKQEFLKKFTDVLGGGSTSTASMRFQMAVRLYYRVIEALLRQEVNRFALDDFSQLLHNETTHKCLLGCAVEVVMTVYASHPTSLLMSGSQTCSSSAFTFPWLLKVFSIQAVDFFRVLQYFIQAEPNLTHSIYTHLQRVEEQILESTAWQSDSSVFESLSCCEIESTKGEISDTTTDKSANEKEMTRQLLRVRGPPGSSLNSPRTQRSCGLDRFLNKVHKLAYKRHQELCSRLTIPKDWQLKIWSLFEYCLTQRTDLLKNRHLDQMLMCCIYAICRINDKEVKFKVIATEYKEMEHASQETYKMVHVSGSRYESIITFYNQIFSQSLKKFILQFAPARVQTGLGVPSSSPHISPSRLSLQASPSIPLRGHPNVYVSPMRRDVFKTPTSPSQLTPRTRQLVSIGEGFESEEKFRAINQWIRVSQGTSRNVKSSKRLAFDQMDEATMGSQAEVEPMLFGKRKKMMMPSSLKQPEGKKT